VGNIIWCTSFWRLKHLELDASYSIANSQPRGFELPELEFLKPTLDGLWLMPDEPDFRKKYNKALKQSHKEVAEWLDQLQGDTALACWCRSEPYTLARCHRILVALLIKTFRSDLDVRVDLKDQAWSR